MLCSQPDSATYTPRIPAEKSIENFRQDPDFDYREKAQGATLWQRFLRWLASFLNIKPGTYADTFLSRDLWYILFAAVLILTVYTFFKSDIQGLFYKTSSQQIKMQVLEEDINTLNFDSLIEDAVKNQNYRYAIRLSYLKNLKELHDKGLIDWKVYKTNLDYLQELKGRKMYDAFSAITQLFNWIWYGDISLSEAEYRQFKTEFVQFSNQLGAKG